MLSLPFRRKPLVAVEARSADPLISIDEYIGLLNTFGFQGHQYTIPGARQEEPSGTYTSVVNAAYKSSGVVFACMLVRMLLFSEARFQYRALSSGRPGKLFGTADLRPLENPWPGATTGDLLSRSIQYADLAGNSYAARRPGGRVKMLRPDWVTLVIGSEQNPDVAAWDVDAEVIGYVYHPGGRHSGRPATTFLAGEVAHFAPIPDPEAQFRGMSWLTPIIREVMADKAMTDHKLSSMENGATPNLIVKFDLESVEKMKPWIEMFKENHEGIANRHKTLFLGAGTDASPVGANFDELQFKLTQGAGETRIAAAAGVPPVIVGLSEGLQAATYANYSQARRRFADGTMRPLWRNMAGSLAQIVTVPPAAELWYDDRDIPFLQEDQADAADIIKTQAEAVNAFVTAGFEPDSARDAVNTGDLTLLKHTGNVSVQLQPPGLPKTPATPKPKQAGQNGRRHMPDEMLDRLLAAAKEG